MGFLVIFDSLSAGMLLIYNVWSWSVAGSGLTTVEFISRQTGYKANYYDFSFQRVRDNMFKIFGTKSVFGMLSPSLRYNAFNGIEWSFQMKDLGFNEQGELQNGSGADEEARNLRSNQSIEMTNVQDPEGDEEAENTEIAI
jgi:hypothetical protein